MKGISPLRFSVAMMMMLCLSVLLIVIYTEFIEERNSYLGYFPLEMGVSQFLSFGFVLLAISLLFTLRLEKPSDFFSTLYTFLVVFPYTIYFSVAGPVSIEKYITILSVLLLPVILVFFVANLLPKIKVSGFIPDSMVSALLFMIAAAVVFYSFSIKPDSSSFSIGDVYSRRLEGREIFTSGSLVAYANSIVLNGIAPFLAFMSGMRNKKITFVFALGIGVFFFYILGVKASFLFILMAYAVGLSVRWKQLKNLMIYLMLILFSIAFLSVVELIFFDYSYLADYFIRRAFVVPPFLVSTYFGYFNSAGLDWSFWAGLVDMTKPITYVVGEDYLMRQNQNANTNTFIFFLGQYGLIGYSLCVILVTSLFFLIDSVYKKTENANLLFVSFIFTILIIEKSATTAFVSSGIFLVLLLSLFGVGKKREYV
ncbi:hypothetical protein BCS58_03385 [Enterovibrio norvegicus]|uniref:hypothetical protein n=1 Tax=Enterovibrio norvegicus TaxID=188144 RepID=UPI003899D7B6